MFCLRNLSVQGSGFRVQNLRSFLCTALFIILFALFSLYPNSLTSSPASADWVFDADPPTCTISFTATDSLRTSAVTVTVDVTDALSNILSSSLSLGATQVASITNSPAAKTRSYLYTWPAGLAGTYTFTAVATDEAGNSRTCATETFTRTNPNCNTPAATPCTACSGAANNTCSANNGTQTCTWDSYSGGGACNTVTTTPQCTYNNCDTASGYVCVPSVPGTCITPPTAPTNPTGLCPAPGTTASLSWGASVGVSTTYSGSINSGTINTPFSTTNTATSVNNTIAGDLYGLSLPTYIPPHNTTWNVRGCNGAGCSVYTAGGQFPCTPSSPTLSAPSLADCTGNTYTGTLTWGGSPYYTDPDGSGVQLYQWGSWVNISINDPGFSTYYQKWVACTNPQDRTTCTNTTPIPGSPGDRFTYFNNNNTLDTLDNNTSGSPNVYYYRVYNGNASTPANLQFSKTCPPLPPQRPLEASCTPPKRGEPPMGTANLLWTAPAVPPSTPADYYNIVVSPESGGTTYSPSSAPTSTSGTVPGLPVNTTYNWTISSCSNSTTPACGDQLTKSTNPTTPSFTCEPAPAWLRTSGGDVHSNR